MIIRSCDHTFVAMQGRTPINIRNRADLLRRFEIDDELEFDRLLEWNISGSDAAEILFT